MQTLFVGLFNCILERSGCMVLGTNPMFPPTALKKATGSTCVHVGTVHLYVHTVHVYQSTFHVSFASGLEDSPTRAQGQVHDGFITNTLLLILNSGSSLLSSQYSSYPPPPPPPPPYSHTCSSIKLTLVV